MTYTERTAARQRRRAQGWCGFGCASALLVGVLLVSGAVTTAARRGDAIALLGLAGSMLAGILILAISIRQAAQQNRLARRYARGAHAERQVRAVLDALPEDRWVAVHHVPTGRGDIDHVLIGVDGRIIVIETKAARGVVQRRDDGRLTVNGRVPDRDWDDQVRWNAAWAARAILRAHGLRVVTIPIIVAPFATVVAAPTVASDPQRPQVFDLDDLQAWLQQPAPALRLAARIWARRAAIRSLLRDTNEALRA